MTPRRSAAGSTRTAVGPSRRRSHQSAAVYRPPAGLAERGVDDAERDAGDALEDRRRQEERVDAVVREAVVRAHGALAVAVWIPRDADRRSEIVDVVLVEIAGHPVERVAGCGV